MKIPYSIQGALFGPALIVLALIFKLMCPETAGAACFADHLAVPIFLPLILAYKVLGESLVVSHELWFVFLYWILVGFLAGLIFDLRNPRSQYSPEPHPPL
ncbi:MAG: hypothetical protein Q8P21_02400 [bacterium]|nr:hypothetical protein [bacterium]